MHIASSSRKVELTGSGPTSSIGKGIRGLIMIEVVWVIRKGGGIGSDHGKPALYDRKGRGDKSKNKTLGRWRKRSLRGDAVDVGREKNETSRNDPLPDGGWPLTVCRGEFGKESKKPSNQNKKY